MSGAFDNTNLFLVDNLEDAAAFLSWAGQRHEHDIIAFDTETEGLRPWSTQKVRLIQVGDTQNGFAFPPEMHGLALDLLAKYEGELVAHNSRFDVAFLKKQYPTQYEPDWRRIHDTMTMAQLDDSTRPAGLKPLTGMLISREAEMSQSVLDREMALNGWDWATVPITRSGVGSSYWIYAALDPVLTTRLYGLLKHVRTTYARPYDLEMGALRCIYRMERKGMRVDLEHSRKMIEEFSAKAQEIRTWISDAYGVLNAGSNIRLIEAFEDLGREITEFTDSGTKSMNKTQLQKFLVEGDGDLPGNDLARAVLEMRKIEKQIGPYFQAFEDLVDADGFVRPSVRPMGARTGRMSITSPALQTLPKGDPAVRDAFIAREGHTMGSIDADQIEMRLSAHFSRDEGLRKAFLEEPDFFNYVASQVWDRPITKADPERGLIKGVCVPLDTEILTQRGWLKHDEVVVGDYTIGYDLDRKVSTWTKITEVVHPGESLLVEMRNSFWSMVTTPDHRWVFNPEKTNRIEWTTTATIPWGGRILLSMPFDGAGGGLSISDDEATLLGWALSDGELAVEPYVGGTSQAGGSRCGVRMLVRQSRKKHAVEIEELLSSIPHRADVSKRLSDYCIWTIKADFARSLAERTGFYTEDGSRPDPVQLAFQFSPRQRELVLDAMRKADGDPFNKSNPWTISFYETLTFLDGECVSTWSDEPDGKNWQRKTRYRVRRRRPIFTTQRAQRNSLPAEPVWCVNTDLGTWTMRQGGRMMTTGNCYGRLYGAGTEKMALTAGVPEPVIENVMGRFNANFPGLTRLARRVEQAAGDRAKKEGRPYILTPMGRKLYGDSDREFALTNYLLQGHAAELLKQGICDLDAAGLGEFMDLPVHDELIFEVPDAEFDEVQREFETVLNNVGSDYFVPLTWGSDKLGDRWGNKARMKS